MTALLLSLFVMLAGMQQPPAAADGPADITRVRELYALAAYEDALGRLDAAGANIDPQDAAQYRALCLLGLGRVVEAEQTMERFVVDYPEYMMSEGDVSPRLVSMFRDARTRVLPATARARYSEAKSAYDRQQFTRAARAFREVDALLGDEALVDGTPGLRDLKMLTEGFLRLAEDEVEKAEGTALTTAAPAGTAPAAPVAVSAPAPTPAADGPAPRVSAATPSAPAATTTPAPAAAPSPSTGPVYSEIDVAVVPPEEVSRWMPRWNPPAVMARMQYRGLLEVVVNEQGTVSSAVLVRPVHQLYDSALIEATSRWRFKPATRDGAPVAYRRTMEIVLGAQ